MHEPRDHRAAERELERELDLERPHAGVLGRTLANVLGIAGVGLAVAWLLGQFDLDSTIGARRSTAGVEKPPLTARPDARAVTLHGPGLTIPPDGRGHFVLTATADGIETRFLIDTGASVVVLSRPDAAALGLHPDMLDYTIRLSTANGEIAAAPVVLREIAIGDLRVADVDAVVVRSPLEVSLLGASFLSRLDGYEVSPAGLTLRW